MIGAQYAVLPFITYGGEKQVTAGQNASNQ
jgi:hypothetical protein